MNYLLAFLFSDPSGTCNLIARFDAQHEGVIFLGYFLLEADQIPEIEFPED
ncbi:hypothetical protein ACIHDR_08565 [Nocardia sp. NPDC052278]|uniref:hypothetical protein n=1 Tax=unclassified Nocardia TaxID=2637762 RepID=UPI00368CB2EF